jgi:nucleoside triphosphate pyrophosphatase
MRSRNDFLCFLSELYGGLTAPGTILCYVFVAITHGKRRMKLILASSSPRRAEVLRNAGFTFEIRPAPVDETRLSHESAEAYVERIADAKAQAAAAQARQAGEPAIIVAADTTVLIDGHILEKPADAADARRMLRLLSGRTHEVLTALAVINIASGQESLHVERTRVEIVKLSEDEIENYIATGEPFDKAGAYGIQGIAGRFAARINGCYFNVLGMPLSRLWTTLHELGWKESEQA